MLKLAVLKEWLRNSMSSGLIKSYMYLYIYILTVLEAVNNGLVLTQKKVFT